MAVWLCVGESRSLYCAHAGVHLWQSCIHPRPFVLYFLLAQGLTHVRTPT